jgi:hypothetical protein
MAQAEVLRTFITDIMEVHNMLRGAANVKKTSWPTATDLLPDLSARAVQRQTTSQLILRPGTAFF